MTVAKVGYVVPVSQELLVDALPFRTFGMNAGARAAEYLRLGQPIRSGRPDRNPAGFIEQPDGFGQWWDFGWPQYLPDDYCDCCD